MNANETRFKRWLVVVLFAIAMAWVESSVVFYLRTMIDRIEPYQPYPLPIFGGLAAAELPRELATLIMIFTVGWLAGKTRQSRVGYALIAFGVWDIFYYVFLKVLTNWPHSLLDWDALFLLPLPWWGPVLAPVCIAALMILWGTLVTQNEMPERSFCAGWKAWTLNLIGCLVALIVFMVDEIAVVGHGEHALRNVLPTAFNWPVFSIALLLMAAPVFKILRQLRQRRSIPLALTQTI